jgi:hypothetical protein
MSNQTKQESLSKCFKIIKDVNHKLFMYETLMGKIKGEDVANHFIEYQELEPERVKFSQWLEENYPEAIYTAQTKQESRTELLDALYSMYVQYCGGGHDFMNAGEDASELLENAGYIQVDEAGRITKDNGYITAHTPHNVNKGDK